ncbi:MAG: protein translocase subunit SecF [Candidatus Hydrothermarchaeota archaeon]|nr:protein translocase subunit SecF [Candidatus Hydrothermarchaeota archaeon]
MFDLKKLMVLPVLMLAVSLVVIGVNAKANTIPMGVDLKGGTLITVYSVPRGIDLEASLGEKLGYKVQADTISDLSGVVGYTIQMDGFLGIEKKEELQVFLSSLGIPKDKISIRDAQPSISAQLLKDGIKAVLFAFLFMAVVIFLRFKTLVPSFAIVLSAFSDIVTTIAVMMLLEIKLTSGSFVALLLLIGYSVDTDILLTTRLLMRKAGNFQDRFYGAVKTGLTMSATALVAITILYLASTSIVLKEIAVVIIIGLLIDVINTWIQNARILQWHLEGRK